MRDLLKTLVIIFLILCSCENEIDLIGPFDERYVLSCIVGDKNTTHFAFLTRSYGVDSEEVNNNNIKSIRNAKIKLLENDKTFYFHDTVIYKDTEGFDSVECYVLNGYEPHSNSHLKLMCELPNGEVLSAKTYTFPEEYYNFENFNRFIPGEYWKNGYGFQFNFGESIIVNESYQYFPSLKVYYTKKRERDEIQYVQEIPNKIVEVNDKSINHYPQAVPLPFVDYELDALKKGLLDICEEGYDPEEYKIVSTEFSVYLPDQYFTKYFMSNWVHTSSVNVLLEKPYFSNIEGGMGIFASYTVTTQKCYLKKEFVNYLGFRSVY